MKRTLYKKSLTRKAKRHDVLNKNAQKWVDALLSGKYKQTEGVLCSVSDKGKLSFCCLGVACEVAIANGVKLNVKPYGEHMIGAGKQYNKQTTVYRLQSYVHRMASRLDLLR